MDIESFIFLKALLERIRFLGSGDESSSPLDSQELESGLVYLGSVIYCFANDIIVFTEAL